MIMFNEEYNEEYEYNMYNVLLTIFFYIMLFLFDCLALYMRVLILMIVEICKVIILYVFTFTNILLHLLYLIHK